MGPCLCGDIYCSWCGNPQAALTEDAEAAMLEKLNAFGLTPHEYDIVADIGIKAVELLRQQLATELANRNAIEQGL